MTGDTTVPRETAAGTPRRSRLKSAMFLLVSLAFTSVLIVQLQQEGGIGRIREVLAGADRAGVATFALMSMVALLVRALRYQLLVRTFRRDVEPPSYGAFVVVTAIRNALIDLLPARIGDASFILYAHRLGVPPIAATTSFATSIVLDVVVLLGLAAIFIACAPTAGEALAHPWIAAGAAGSLALAAVVGLRAAPALIERTVALAERLQIGRQRGGKRILDAVREIGHELKEIRGARDLIPLLVLTAVLRLIKYGSLYLLLIAVLGQWGIGSGEIDPLVVTVAFITAEAASSLPVSGVMGFGAYEGAWAAVLGITGGRIPSTATVIFSVHLITQLVAYSAAGVAFAVFPFLNPKSTTEHRNSSQGPQSRVEHVVPESR